MNERVHKALDGDFDRNALSAPELEALLESEARIDAVLRAIPAQPLPDLAPAVLHRIKTTQRLAANPAPNAKLSSSAWRVTDWLWRPRPVSIGWRPAYGLAAAALVGVLLATNLMRRDPVSLLSTQQVFTQFVLRAPDAERVALAGDFTGWQPAITMTRSEPGVWTVVVPLDPGIHQYSFVVDGVRWVADPTAPAVNDGFGGVNSRVAVLMPDARKL